MMMSKTLSDFLVMQVYIVDVGCQRNDREHIPTPLPENVGKSADC